MRLGDVLMVVGTVIVVAGAVVRFFPRAFSWFGNLPGDVRIEGENTRVFIPIVSMLVVSVLITIVVNLLTTLFRDR